MNHGYLQKNLERVHEWIRSADQKVSIFLAFEGVVLSFLIPEIKSFYTNHPNSGLKFFTTLLIISSAIYFYSICKLLFALISRTQPKQHKPSLSFFGDIAKETLKDYRRQTQNAKSEDIEDDFIIQIHVSSVIATKKHSAFITSIKLFAYSMAILVLDIIYFYLWSIHAK
jgi:hypothetical protein